MKGFVDTVMDRAPFLRYCALGFWLAWTYLAFNSGIWIDKSELSYNPGQNIFISSTIGFILTCLLLGVFHKKVVNAFSNQHFFAVVGIVCALSCVVIRLCGPDYLYAIRPGFAAIASLIAGFITGVCTCICACRCVSFYAYLVPNRAWIYGLVNILIAAGIFFMATSCRSFVGSVVFCVLPLFFGFMLSSDPEGELDAKECESSTGKARMLDQVLVSSPDKNPLFKRLCGMLLALTCGLSMIRHEGAAALSPDVVLQIGIDAVFFRVIVAVILLLIMLSMTKEPNFSSLYYIVLLVVVFVPLLAAVFSITSPIVNALVTAFYNVFEVMILCVLAALSSRSRDDSVVVYAKGWGSVTLGGLVGLGLTYVIPLAFPTENNQMILALLVAIICIPIALFVFTGNDFRELLMSCIVLRHPDDDLPCETNLGSGLPQDAQKDYSNVSTHESVDEKFKWFAERYALSTREAEIMRELLLGKKPHDISAEYFLSINTVRRHIQNVYTKTNVHSRSDLFVLFRTETADEQGKIK